MKKAVTTMVRKKLLLMMMKDRFQSEVKKVSLSGLLEDLLKFSM